MLAALVVAALALLASLAPTAIAAPSARSTGIPDTRACGHSIYAARHTSCSFARSVKRAWYRQPRSVERVYSPITGKTYAMRCQPALGTVHCHGPHDLYAAFPNIGFGP